MKKKYIYLSIALVLVVGLVGFRYSQPALGNPSQTISEVRTATATTTMVNISAGVSTTTLVYDLFSGTGSSSIMSSTTNILVTPVPGGNTFIADKALLKIQYAASSSAASILNADVEYSQDGVDWYFSPWSPGYIAASSTSPFSIAAHPTLQLGGIGTSTIDFQGVANVNIVGTTTRLVILDTPMRYVRVMFTVPVGAKGGQFWASIVGIKQTP